jgi:plastocyanin
VQSGRRSPSQARLAAAPNPSAAPSERRIPRRSAYLALAAVLILVLAACGGGNSNTTTTTTTGGTTTKTSSGGNGGSSVPPSTKATATEKLSLEANPKGELKYNTTTLTAKAGVAAITLTNNSPLAHNVTIEDSSGKIIGGSTTFTGGSHTIRIPLKAGTYKFFCSVPGHRQAGMEGTLTVE